MRVKPVFIFPLACSWSPPRRAFRRRTFAWQPQHEHQPSTDSPPQRQEEVEERTSCVQVTWIHYDSPSGESEPPPPPRTMSCPPGRRLLAVAHELGIHVPRNCRSAYCGSCEVIQVGNEEDGDNNNDKVIKSCIATVGTADMILDCSGFEKYLQRLPSSSSTKK